jgi:hypothetical protein
MGLLGVSDRARRGNERLPDHLPTEDATAALRIAAATMQIRLDLLGFEQGNQCSDVFRPVRH